MEAFRGAFAVLSYVPCDTADVESGFEKIALFADAEGTPTHAARQLPGGRWTSKLGRLEDIAHELNAVAGEEYGTVVEVMKRPAHPSAGGAGER